MKRQVATPAHILNGAGTATHNSCALFDSRTKGEELVSGLAFLDLVADLLYKQRQVLTSTIRIPILASSFFVYCQLSGSARTCASAKHEGHVIASVTVFMSHYGSEWTTTKEEVQNVFEVS
jgi:hypothetical protein